MLKALLATEALSRGFTETLWIDAAIDFDPNDVVKIRAHGLPIVAGVYPRAGGQGFDLDVLPGTDQLTLGVAGGLREVGFAGLGFLHARREVYEAVSKQFSLPDCQTRWGQGLIPFFSAMTSADVTPPVIWEADFAFCQRARQCGYKIMVDTSIRLWRNGNYRYSWEDVGGGLPRYASFDLRFASGQESSPSSAAAVPAVSNREPFEIAELDEFRRDHPWPENKPAVPAREKEGWLFPSTQEMLSRFLSSETKLVVELGSWLGLSTRFIASRAPRATVIAIDHWKGSSEHQHDPAFLELLPKLYETFLVNCWQEQARIIPVRKATTAGLERVARSGLLPDLIYVDADHDFAGVTSDLEAIERLFPRAMIVGDDWNWDGVRQAATAFSKAAGRQLEALETGWCVHASKYQER